MITQSRLHSAGQHGYHSYRIPAIVVSQRGTVLVFCEGRKNSKRDNGDIDIILMRSFDRGENWEEMKIIADFGVNVIGNPCPVVDQKTGVIWLLLTSNPFINGYENEINKGLAARDVYAMNSSDDGETWSEPACISNEVKKENWTWYATGPGHGLQMNNGRILIPCNHAVFDPEVGQSHPSRSHVFYSDDLGVSWHIGGELEELTNECTAVETENGLIYLNMRSYDGKNRRAYAWSKDGGITWTQSQLDDSLIEPVCQGSVIRFSNHMQHGKSRILFSNPASLLRERMTVKLSYDECNSWPIEKVLLAGFSSYSDLAVGKDMRIYCVYEYGFNCHNDGNICIARFDLDWLTDGQDALNL